MRAKEGECPPGQVRVTGAGNLAARYVIHAVGPVWNGGGFDEDAILESTYRHSLEVTQVLGTASISFPCISTGAYGFPAERAAAIAFSTVRLFVKKHRWPLEVRFVVFSERDFRIYRELFSSPLS